MVCLRGVRLLNTESKECTWGCVKRGDGGGGGGGGGGVRVNYLSTESTGDGAGERERVIQ